MKLILVLVLSAVVCASAWKYRKSSTQVHVFDMPDKGVLLLNEQQRRLHDELAGYEFSVLRNAMNLHVTCATSNFKCQLGEPFNTVILNDNALTAPSGVGKIIEIIDDHVRFEYRTWKYFSDFARATVERASPAFAQSELRCTARSWSCVVDVPSTRYEGFSVGYTTSSGPAPTIPIPRTLTFNQAQENNISPENYAAAIRATYDPVITDELAPILYVVHSCHTFTDCELLKVDSIPFISPSDELARKTCLLVRVRELPTLACEKRIQTCT